MRRIRVLVAALTCCALLAAAAIALAAETVSIHAQFSPGKLGAPTSVSGSATIGSSGGPVPSPVTKVTIMGPSGMGLNLAGIGICDEERLRRRGPKACPRDSIAGGGTGRGAIELTATIIREPFTIRAFRGPNEGGHVTALLYVEAVSPVAIKMVYRARVLVEPKPYGLGLSFDVPPIPTLAGSSTAAVEQASLTLGASRYVHGRRGTFHTQGVVLPRTCPSTGFPIQTVLSFEDGATSAVKTAIPCPAGSRQNGHRSR